MGELPIYLGLTSRARESGCSTPHTPKNKKKNVIPAKGGRVLLATWGVAGVWYILISRRLDVVFAHSKSGASQFCFFLVRHFKLTALNKSCCRLGFSRAGKSSKLNPLGSSIFDCVCRSYKNSPKDRALHTHRPVWIDICAGGWMMTLPPLSLMRQEGSQL